VDVSQSAGQAHTNRLLLNSSAPWFRSSNRDQSQAQSSKLLPREAVVARSSAATSNHKKSRHRPEEVSKTGRKPQCTKPVHTNCLSFEASICNKSNQRSQAPTVITRVGSANRHASKLDGINEKAKANNEFWRLCDEAIDSGDYKLHSKDAEWRSQVLASHDKIFEVVKGDDRPLRQAARLVRSNEADRPCRNTNPNSVAAHLQPALSEGLMEQSHAQHLVNLATQRG